MTKPIEIKESLLCSKCGNAAQGVMLAGEPVCIHCVTDPELVRQIILVGHPELAKLDRAIAEGVK